ncbi:MULTISPECIES: MBL fold metallo-hydrolase [Solibacillus]|uniref:MBL fold metallo-hydrolase n=1 Tax=Solibacillus merdavium TaxID=2762218 RepID=A0ABR8XSY7_9BACL|nr:MBL fold metallo-hydrolase [Solibacillus merdavium]MBD8035056.1 MBL fold metallo-hydrolase [Solibacillus merdavium]
MLFKKKSEISEKSGVKMINGFVKFQSVRLNVYCFEFDGVLIDTGAASLLEEFKTFFSMMDVDQVMLTHYHEDHTGGAHFLQTEYNLPIFMNDTRIAECASKANYPLYRKLFWGTRKPFEALPLENHFSSRTGRWKVIPTPGHTNDHLAFLNEETGQLFTGDLFVTPKTKVVLREENVPQIISSLELAISHDFQEMYCNHAGYIKNGKEALLQKLDFLKELSGKIEQMADAGMTSPEITNQLFDKKYPVTKLSLGEWDAAHIVTSVLKNKIYNK